MRKSIHSKGQEALQNILRNWRIELGLRQEDVAALLGEPQSLISKYESGERRLDLIELREICLVLGGSLGRLVEELEEHLHET